MQEGCFPGADSSGQGKVPILPMESLTSLFFPFSSSSFHIFPFSSTVDFQILMRNKLKIIHYMGKRIITIFIYPWGRVWHIEKIPWSRYLKKIPGSVIVPGIHIIQTVSCYFIYSSYVMDIVLPIASSENSPVSTLYSIGRSLAYHSCLKVSSLFSFLTYAN